MQTLAQFIRSSPTKIRQHARQLNYRAEVTITTTVGDIQASTCCKHAMTRRPLFGMRVGELLAHRS
jgi:hypothetical protein